MGDEKPSIWKLIWASVVCGIAGAALWVIGAAFSGAGHGPDWAGNLCALGGMLFWLGTVALSILLAWRGVALAANRRTHWAARVGIVLLMLVGASIAMMFIRDLAMDTAVREDDVSVCRLCLRLGADELDGHLYVAARLGNLTVVQELVESGANVNARLGGEGDPILVAAVENVHGRRDGNIAVVRYLLENGANPCLNVAGESLLARSRRIGRPPPVVGLLERYCREHGCEAR